ncbi:hypothetical protein [Streptosporangium canum]|uniref:hypothetical protein n=1 Tax=Streptosporangium canum TaxID=324952 RepID=UPI0033B80807
MPAQITVLAVGTSFDGRLVLDSVTCSLAGGERTGIVGENGSGIRRRVLTSREAPKHLPVSRSSLWHAAG